MKITPRVFSGMQPTGSLHLGNYLGAMVNWIKMQDTHECIYCVVDLHAITVAQDPAELRTAIRQVTAAYIAAGLDPKKSILFNQSQVSAHAELAWVFNCIARLGWLNRMTQFKEKAGKDREQASVGLYAYPNLMAADILAYRSAKTRSNIWNSPATSRRSSITTMRLRSSPKVSLMAFSSRSRNR